MRALEREAKAQRNLLESDLVSIVKPPRGKISTLRPPMAGSSRKPSFPTARPNPKKMPIVLIVTLATLMSTTPAASPPVNCCA